MVRYVLVHHGTRISKDPTVFAVVFAFPAQMLHLYSKSLNLPKHREKKGLENRERLLCSLTWDGEGVGESLLRIRIIKTAVSLLPFY